MKVIDVILGTVEVFKEERNMATSEKSPKRTLQLAKGWEARLGDLKVEVECWVLGKNKARARQRLVRWALRSVASVAILTMFHPI